MKLKLNELLRSFQANFGKLYQGGEKEKVNIEITMKKEIKEIAKLVYSTSFELENIDEIYNLVKTLFDDN